MLDETTTPNENHMSKLLICGLISLVLAGCQSDKGTKASAVAKPALTASGHTANSQYTASTRGRATHTWDESFIATFGSNDVAAVEAAFRAEFPLEAAAASDRASEFGERPNGPRPFSDPTQRAEPPRFDLIDMQYQSPALDPR